MPKRIGKYEITAEIGRGGFSRVYRGHDPSVNRPVAIKISTRESDPEHLSRFRNEASAAGNLHHESIVTIHDYGDDDGVPYLVMELLDGRDLHHIMRDGPKLSILEKMQIMSQVAEGMNCAHMNGVVHRDIKPANVMVLANGSVKILDFGIARMTGEVSRLTQSGYLVGTPLYMSPEQLNGGDADTLCDVWAYGVLYFELLTGQHPFLSQDNTRLVRNISIVNPPSVHALTRGVPEGLALVIRRALTKDRRRRYQSMEEVLVDTNPILGLLQREQTAGLVSEAEVYRSSGQLIAARQSSRRALEIDPSNPGAQQLLKTIQNEIHEESYGVPVEVAHAAAIVPPPPPVAVPVARQMERMERVAVAPPPPPPPAPVDVPVAAPPAPAPVAATMPVAVPVMPPPVVPAAPPAVAPVAARPAAVTSAPATATPEPPRTGVFSGAAAAIAAAVAAAKARQAEEEKQLHEQQEETVPAPAIMAPPIVVTALPTTQLTVPAPPPTSTLKRAENGSGVFVTGEPLVVKRPATAVMTQRLRTAEASVAATASSIAVDTPPPAPPSTITRLPGARAIPPSRVRSGSNGSSEAPAAPPSRVNGRGEVHPDNLPMRRPPSEVYANTKRRRSSSSIYNEKRSQSKPFPWAIAGFVLAAALVAVAVLLFSLSTPAKTGPVLVPDKLAFAWKPSGPIPAGQAINLNGGAASSSFTATSDQDWLLVTAGNDEPSNRTWTVKVDPEKLASNVPNTYTGWIDITSSEGKEQVEVTLKVGAGDSTTPGGKNAKKPAAVVEKPTAPAPAAANIGTMTAAPAPADPAKTATPKPLTPKPAAPKAVVPKPITPAIPPAKKPTTDGIDIN